MSNISNTVTMKKITRKGAGRTKGSFSFVAATMSEVAKLNPNPDFKWLFSRKQIENLGGTGFTTDRVSELNEALAGQSEQTKVEVKATEL